MATAAAAAESSVQGRAAGPPLTSKLATVPIPAQNPVGIAATAGRLWVTDAGTGEVLELNPSTGKLLSKFKLELKQPKGLAFDGQRLWVADPAGRQLVAYDAAGGKRVRAIPLQAPEEKGGRTIAALGWDGKALWAVLAGDSSNAFAQIDPASGRLVRSIPADCDPRGIAFNANLLYGLCWNGERNLAAVDQRLPTSPAAEAPKSRRVVQVLATSAPAGLAHDGTRLWVLDSRAKRAIIFHGIPSLSGLQPLAATVCDVTNFPFLSWNVCLAWAGDKGIWVASADIRRTPTGPWTRVLDESGPTEIITPYHASPPTHLFDMNPWACLAPLTPVDAGGGTLLSVPTDYPPGPCTSGTNVVREIRDRGVAYLCKDFYSTMSRGKEVVYWSVFDPGNYDYIVEYGFRDDGTITFRMGATGFNNPGRPLEAHMHDAIWRVHPDIGGLATSSVFLKTHKEITTTGLSQATDSSTHVNAEGFSDFDPLAFTSLRFQGTSLNALHHPMGYDLVPLVQGSARHSNSSPGDPEEVFAQHDFFVRNFDSTALFSSLGLPQAGTYLYPDHYVVTNTPQGIQPDVVLFYRSAAHHMPSAEDYPSWPGHVSPAFGITLVHWMGFDLVPHDFFDNNPMGGPHGCGSCGDGICNNNEDCCSCPSDCLPPGSPSCC